jgi:hypothetical protein
VGRGADDLCHHLSHDGVDLVAVKPHRNGGSRTRHIVAAQAGGEHCRAVAPQHVRNAGIQSAQYRADVLSMPRVALAPKLGDTELVTLASIHCASRERHGLGVLRTVLRLDTGKILAAAASLRGQELTPGRPAALRRRRCPPPFRRPPRG